MVGNPSEIDLSQANSGLGAVTVLIPALNEEEGLRIVLSQLPAVGRVVVVDNGSTDGTSRVARDQGAVVVDEPRRGYGSACLAGLAEIGRSVRAGAAAPEVILFLDADASDSPELIPQLAGPILAGEQDFVLGSRMRGQREPGAMPPQAAFGNWLASGLMRLIWRAPYTDLGPFRAVRYCSLCELGMTDRDYGWTIEMQMKAWRRRLRIKEVPVPYHRRVGVSKISGTVRGSVAAGVKILWCLARYGWVRR